MPQASSIRALNYFMASLYKSNVFIAADAAVPIIRAGFHFLKAYGRLAFLSHASAVSRFPLVPKCHMFFHVCHDMKMQQQACCWVLNPISFSTASDEDFIGKYCLLTRCVSPRQRILRSLQRYLTQVYVYWVRGQ